jgi:hypothetical protein
LRPERLVQVDRPQPHRDIGSRIADDWSIHGPQIRARPRPTMPTDPMDVTERVGVEWMQLAGEHGDSRVNEG